MKLSPIGALLLAACASLPVATVAVPTLLVTNGTDDQLNVYEAENPVAIGRVGPLGSACIRLRGLPPRPVVLGIRPISGRMMLAFPQDYASSAGWSLLITRATSDGGFFPVPAGPCR